MSGDMASNSSLSSCDLTLLTVAHQALLNISVLISGGNDQQRWQQLHNGQACFFLRSLRGQTLTLLRANAHFSQSSNVAFCGGALLNRSWNAVITWAIVWPMCGLSCTHMLAISRSSNCITACIGHSHNTADSL
jgi:hypothetical protein